ncbi:MAG: hypothetical protein Q9160_009142 [Pyrenula sp. 1 TL-2023]
MEAAGLAVGVVSLYNNFVEVLKIVDAYKSSGLDAQLATDRYNASKLRLQKWAKEVGIKDGPLTDSHDSRLDEPQVASVVKNILRRLSEVFDKAEYTSISSGILQERQPDNHLDWKTPQDGRRSTVALDKPLSIRSRLNWALRRKDRFTKDIQSFEGLVNILHDVVPQYQGNGPTSADLSQLDQKLDILSEFEAGLDRLLEVALTMKRNEVEDWLDAHREDDQYERNASLLLHGTGDWILNHASYMIEDFQQAGAKYLWICGPAGFGKTPIAFLPITQSATQLDGVPRTWAAQLVREDDRILDLAYQVRSKQRSRRASRDDIWKILKETSISIKPFVLLLDGLDEFRAGYYTRELFLHDLKTSMDSSQARILIASRNEVDIESEISSSATNRPSYAMFECRMTKDDVTDDVALFSRSVVDKRLPKKEDAFRQELAGQIANRCEGMFLWIKLQQDRLRGGKSKRELRDIVRAMPLGLHLTYRRSWDTIQSLVDEDRRHAVDTLRLLTFAYRPLNVQELAEALVVNSSIDREGFDEDFLPDTIDDEYINGEIKGLCGSLIEIRSQSAEFPPNLKTVHLVHASVRDFLCSALPLPSLIDLSGEYTICAAQNTILATTCLRFLNSPSASKRDTNGNDRAFTSYATHFWFKHVSEFNGHDRALYDLVNGFLDPENRSFQLKHGYAAATPFYYACLFGLVPVMDFQHEQRVVDVNSPGGLYGTALQAACIRGHIHAFQRLIQWGADTTTRGGLFGNALIAAASHGYFDMVQQLLDRGVDPDLMGHELQTPLMVSAAYGHLDIVRLLLARGARVNPKALSPTKPNTLIASTPLHEAVKYGHHELSSVLLDRGAEIDARDDAGDTCLHLAANRSDPALVKVLLDRGAKADLRGWESTPLYTAARKGHDGIAKMLLEKEADPNTSTISGSTPLLIAAENGHEVVVNLLLQNGADINHQSNAGETALFLATAARHTGIARLLSGRGAEIQTPTDGATTLHLAAEQGSVELATLLMQRGVSVDTETNEGRTPLHLATNQRNLAVVQLLFRNGAKVQGDIYGWTPLHMAAQRGYPDLAAPLIEGGADIHAKDEAGWTPFLCAISSRHFDIADLLLGYNCDYTSKRQRPRAFQDLVHEGNVNHFKNFIERDLGGNCSTDIARDLCRGAILQGSDEMVEVLVSMGIDLSSGDRFGMTMSDWLSLIRPSHKIYQQHCVKKTTERPQGPNITMLRQTIVTLCKASAKETANSASELYNLGRCLLLLGSDDEARAAYQYHNLLQESRTSFSEIVCDVCESEIVFGKPWQKLQGWQILFIVLSGVIGVTILSNGGEALEIAGPGGMLLAYCVIGVIAVAVMEVVSEMIQLFPAPNAIPEYVRNFVDVDLAWVVGIAYWYTYSSVFATQIIAAADFTSFWQLPDVWQIIIFYVITPLVLVGINCAGVEWFGLIETIGGSVKLVMVFIIAIIMYVIAGKEMIAMTAYEARDVVDLRNPSRIVAYLVLFTYLFCVLGEALNVKWTDPELPIIYGGSGNGTGIVVLSTSVRSRSVVVLAAQHAGYKRLPGFLTGCMIFSTLSAANTSLYIASRIMYGMTRKLPTQPWPIAWLRHLGTTTPKTGVPGWALLLSAVFFMWLPYTHLSEGIGGQEVGA